MQTETTTTELQKAKEKILETINYLENHFDNREIELMAKLNENVNKSLIITSMIKEIDDNLQILVRMKFQSQLLGKDTKFEDDRIMEEKGKAATLRLRLIELVGNDA